MTTLFGVGPDVFTGVKERDGYIARADGGVLFLDEAHVLHGRVQKALLRIIEDGRLSRIGESEEREVDVKFVLASNEPGEARGLAEDLLNRLREVGVPPLAQRRADIPSIFCHLFARELEKAGLDLNVDQLLNEYHHEALILDGFTRNNVRGLGDIAERIATRIASGTEPAVAVREYFAKRYAAKYPASSQDELAVEPPRTTYEVPRPDYLGADDKTLVAAAFQRQGGNAAAIKRDLDRQGHELSRRRIRKLLDELGLPRIKRGR
jgi:transcriptional regulator with AAA-type ATPase domain